MRIQTRRSDHGSVLVIMIVVTALTGLTLGSYLHLVANQNQSVMRSMAWNRAVSVAEAGVEEAMAHLHQNGTDLTQDGWTVAGTNVVRERVLGDSRYEVFITKDLDPPIIYAAAYVRDPKTQEYLATPRVIRVTTGKMGLFSKGMVAKGQIDLSGNNVRTDSFDSSDENYSTGGRYDPAKAKDNGDVATNSSLVDSLDVGNADIYGRVSTGPGGAVSVGKNGGVGSASWHAAGKNGIEPGYATDDMNVQFPDVQPPFSGGGFTPSASPNPIGGTNYTYVVGDGNWQMNSLSMSGNQQMLVNGNATLYVLGNVSLSGKSLIFIAPNSSLQLYVAGASTSLSGNGVATSGKASDFGYWGLNSNKAISMSGNAAFTGTIYAPYAALSLSGGGNNDYDFVGASITASVKMSGHFNFHYDEALRSFGPGRGNYITSWNETTWAEVNGAPGN